MVNKSQDVDERQSALPDDIEFYPLLMTSDDEAWTLFHHHYLPRLQNYFLKNNVQTEEDREDLIQTVFTIFCETLFNGKYSVEKGSLAQWLYGIANKLLDRHKKTYAIAYSKQEEFLDEHHDLDPGDSEPVSQELSQSMKDAMSQLSDKYREVIQERISSDTTWQVIADALGISESAAKMRYKRGIAKLAELLSKK